MSLENIQAMFNSSRKPQDELEDVLEEELDDLLDDNSRAEVRGLIHELDDEEFREFAETVFEQQTA